MSEKVQELQKLQKKNFAVRQHNGIMKDLSVLQDSPFTDRGSITEVFTDLTVWMEVKNVIDTINANAA